MPIRHAFRSLFATPHFWIVPPVLAAIAAAGCLSRPLETIEPRRTSVVVEQLTMGGVEKIDLLLAIDNSKSMADKQTILSLAVPDLVRRLANPRCIDSEGQAVSEQPASPTDACPVGSEREFEPVLDMHIGIISSSLGGQGSTACADEPDPTMAHLSTAGANEQTVPTYEGQGFLAWDPAAKLSPHGQTELDTAGGLVPTLADMVQGVGQDGCGYEAQLESWYRFLIDPEPYLSLEVEGNALVPRGVDQTVLDQRADFLRPDSLVVIVMLTDENDCSLSLTNNGKKILDGDVPRVRSECASNVDDPCCMSCNTPLEGTGCPADPACLDESGKIARDTNVNTRCFAQKRRFGVDALMPTDRYVAALTEEMVENRDGELVRSPLFPEPEPGQLVRTQDLVFFAGIVGVPWQDIARNPSDLADGGFKSAAELSEVDEAIGHSGWDLILGDPEAGVAPLDPLMRESVGPRAGEHPITGQRIGVAAGPGSDNDINGHERHPWKDDDLQYACIFELPGEPVECTGDPSCDCALSNDETTNDEQNPLCVGPDGAYGTKQYAAKAYPGTRHLSVLQGLGDQGIVASVCPAYIGPEQDRLDFGYAPAVGAIIDRLKSRLGGQCLARSLTPDDNGQVSCIVLEARQDEACACQGVLEPVSASHASAVDVARQSPAGQAQGWNCFCELPQLSGVELDACQNDPSNHPEIDGAGVDGWCYVDATRMPPIGDASLVAECADNEQRQVRFVGDARLERGRSVMVMCSGE